MFEKAAVAVAALMLAVVTSAHSLLLDSLVHSLETPAGSRPQSQARGATTAPGTPGNNPSQNQLEAFSSAFLKGVIPNVNAETEPTPEEKMIMDKFGITEKLKHHLPPLDIPKKLDGKTDTEIAKYAKQLMKRRRELQRKMSKNIMNNSFLLMLSYFFSSNILIGHKIGSLLWINRNFRDVINADWNAHQEQLSDFLLEYARVKKVDLGELKKNRIVGAPLMKVPYTRRKYVNFPLWKTEKTQHLPSDTDVRSAMNLFKNWWV